MDNGKWLWPLPGHVVAIPVETKNYQHDGAFGHKRKYDIHTGVDLYCKPGQRVVAVENGIVVAIEIFTGPNTSPPSDWWNETKAVLVEGDSGVILYGEINPDSSVELGTSIFAGDLIGTVLTVRKDRTPDSGKPKTMLHFELYDSGIRESTWWNHDEKKPSTLMDPTLFLLECDHPY